MIEYPSDLSTAARAQIEHAIADAELAFIAAEDPGPQMFILSKRGGPDTTVRGVPPARDPVHFVLVVFERVIQTLTDMAPVVVGPSGRTDARSERHHGAHP